MTLLMLLQKELSIFTTNKSNSNLPVNPELNNQLRCQMKIKKISSNAKKWFDLTTPVTVNTPGGTQNVERFFFNGFEQHYDIEFENEAGEIYTAQSTGNHKYQLLDGNWIETENLESGMECHAGWKVRSVLLGQGVLATMDVEVPEEHCYFLANGVVSHNTALLMGGVLCILFCMQRQLFSSAFYFLF